jgi:GDPmannose 4,6-dehydratase
MRGEPSVEPLRSLNFACDWGSSSEFMELGARLLEAEDNQDYVVATGRTWTGLEFTRELFARAGLDWRDHVAVEEPADESFSAPFRADISRMINVLGHGPQQSALDVAAWILSENHGLMLAPSRATDADKS